LSTICIPKVAWYTYFLRLTRSFGAPKSIGDGCSSPFLQVAALQGLMSNECSVEHHMAGYIVLEGYRRSVPIPIPAPLPLGCCKGPRSGHNYLSVYSFMWQQCNEVKLSSEAKRFSQMILLHWPSIKYAIKYEQLCLWSSEPLATHLSRLYTLQIECPCPTAEAYASTKGTALSEKQAHLACYSKQRSINLFLWRKRGTIVPGTCSMQHCWDLLQCLSAWPTWNLFLPLSAEPLN